MKKTLFEDMMAKIERNKKQGSDENIGKTVGSSTLLVEEIGRGAMGAVYLGYDTKLDRQVAVKVLLREMFADQRQFELLKTLLVQEGRNLAKVKHRGIVEVYELDDHFPALIMELIENGEDLQTFLYKKKSEWATTGFRLWFLSMMEQIAFALGAAHAQGVIHKDLKFGNVMIFKDSEGEWRTKVIDFGLAQNLMHIKLTHGVTLMGSPSYMAPEQWEDHWAIDAKADVYSFGVMLYEVLMQQDYHQSEAIEEIKAQAKDSLFVQKRTGHLPIDQRTIFEFLLAIERSRRAGGMLEVVGVLRNLRLAITYRDKEAPGTSFPPPPSSGKEVVAPVQSSHKVMDQVQAEFEDGLETPPPVSVPISNVPKPPVRHEKTILGPQVVPEAVPASAPIPQADASFSIVVEQPVAKPVQLVPEPVQAMPEPQEDLQAEPMVAHNEEDHGKKWFGIMGIVTLIVLFGGLSYFLFFKNKGNDESKDEKQQVVATKKVEPPKEVPKKVEPPMAPTEAPKQPEKPSIPLPPTKIGEFPSDEYATYLFQQEDKWCHENDPRKAEFKKFPMWRVICLRNRVMSFYSRDRENPEPAIALLDETYAQACSHAMVHRKQGAYIVKDTFLAKECAVLESFYKKFNYFIQGERVHAADKFLTDRRPRRLQIQEEWKKANSTENPPNTP